VIRLLKCRAILRRGKAMIAALLAGGYWMVKPGNDTDRVNGNENPLF
jgi:hypothetical protein